MSTNAIQTAAAEEVAKKVDGEIMALTPVLTPLTNNVPTEKRPLKKSVKARFARVAKQIEAQAKKPPVQAGFREVTLTSADAAADLKGEPRPDYPKNVAKKRGGAVPPPPPVKRSRGRPEVTSWFNFDEEKPFYEGEYDVRLRAFPSFVGRAIWNGYFFRCEAVAMKKGDIVQWRGRAQP